MFKSLVKH